MILYPILPNFLSKEDMLYLDSGASHNFLNFRSLFLSYRKRSSKLGRTASGILDIVGKGTVYVSTSDGMNIKDCHVTHFDANIMATHILPEYLNVLFTTTDRTGKESSICRPCDTSFKKWPIKVNCRNGLYALNITLRSESAMVPRKVFSSDFKP